jgi:hypothetical protein
MSRCAERDCPVLTKPAVKAGRSSALAIELDDKEQRKHSAAPLPLSARSGREHVCLPLSLSPLVAQPRRFPSGGGRTGVLSGPNHTHTP